MALSIFVGQPSLQVEWRGEVHQLAWSPRLFLYKGFLSDEECDHLMDKVSLRFENGFYISSTTVLVFSTGRLLLQSACCGAAPSQDRTPLPDQVKAIAIWLPTKLCMYTQARARLAKSEVVDNDSGEGKLDEVRTSSGAFFDNGEDAVSFSGGRMSRKAVRTSERSV